MNVQSIHNETFAKALPPTFLSQALTLASWHEYGVFTSPQLDGIGNSTLISLDLECSLNSLLVPVAGRTILPQMLSALASIANASDPLKLAYQSLSYKPFLSLFNMTGAAQQNPLLTGVGQFSSPLLLGSVHNYAINMQFPTLRQWP
jgi:prostatic aicd phosphatase